VYVDCLYTSSTVQQLCVQGDQERPVSGRQHRPSDCCHAPRTPPATSRRTPGAGTARRPGPHHSMGGPVCPPRHPHLPHGQADQKAGQGATAGTAQAPPPARSASHLHATTPADCRRFGSRGRRLTWSCRPGRHLAVCSHMLREHAVSVGMSSPRLWKLPLANRSGGRGQMSIWPGERGGQGRAKLLTFPFSGASCPSLDVAGRGSICRLAAVTVAGDSPTSLGRCLRWLPVWLPDPGTSQ
jgi:hypothetical protein